MILSSFVGHYYWKSGTAGWIDEGAITFTESMAWDALHGPPLPGPCALRSIAELEDLERNPSTSGAVRSCHYSLGERLFRDLYRSMDDTTFRLAFRRLYVHTLFDGPNDGCDTICRVKTAFTTDIPEETAAAVEGKLREDGLCFLRLSSWSDPSYRLLYF